LPFLTPLYKFNCQNITGEITSRIMPINNIRPYGRVVSFQQAPLLLMIF
jgi:hypothetical protein